ncbi:MAG: hypothetical protein M3R15_24640 [Acidobacteriota bacterium]|nr:hypothetical protein [Acidobacteriota bacterium]
MRDVSKQRLAVAIQVLREQHPMTVRQVYYQLVARQVLPNKVTMYQAVSELLRDARKSGDIPWEWIEDRLRRPRTVGMWSDLSAFAETVRRAYRRDVWTTQPNYIEVWLEKDALSGIFEDVLRDYGVTLNVGRGFDGWDSIRNAGNRYIEHGGVTILYFGDFDPSGEDMVRSLRERIDEYLEIADEPFGDGIVDVEIIKCALTAADIARYNLPSDFAKKTDSRAKKFIAKHGDVSVELDALPVAVLRDRLQSEVAERLDLDALEKVKETEDAERVRLVELLTAA